MTTGPSPIPEPATLAMFGAGLIAAAGFAAIKTKRILNLDILSFRRTASPSKTKCKSHKFLPHL
jgi:hypothetical protein